MIDNNIQAIDIEISVNKDVPKANKLTIYTIYENEDEANNYMDFVDEANIEISNPNISTDNNDIFGMLEDPDIN